MIRATYVCHSSYLSDDAVRIDKPRVTRLDVQFLASLLSSARKLPALVNTPIIARIDRTAPFGGISRHEVPLPKGGQPVLLWLRP